MSLSGDLSERFGYQFNLRTNPRQYFAQTETHDELVGYEFLTDSTFAAPYLGFG